MKKISFLFLIGLAIILAGCSLPGLKIAPKACTLEAKICPDGSAVGRTGPNCEFAECPTSAEATAGRPATSTVQMANPASVNCKAVGGNLVIQTRGDGGQYGLCYFEDNRACEEWALMRGDCPIGGMKTTGFDTDAQKYCAWSGGSTFAVDNAVCIFKDGSQCPDENFYKGDCQKGDNIDVIAAIKDLFIKKYNKKTDEVTITINQQDATHIRGGVKFGASGVGEGGIFLAAKVNGVWQLIFDGNGQIDCALVAPYNFPADMISDCAK